MNFESLKIGFLSYLQDKFKRENKEYMLDEMNLSSTNIFMYQAEFEEYVKQTTGSDISIFSQDISEIESLDFENGQFVYPDDIDEENELLVGLVNEMLNVTGSNDDKAFSKTEAITYLSNMSGKDGDVSSLSINDMFTDRSSKNSRTSGTSSVGFLSNVGLNLNEKYTSTIISLFDKNKDGTLSTDEQSAASGFLSSIDGNSSKLSQDDISGLTGYIDQQMQQGLSIEQIINNIYALDGDASSLSAGDFTKITGSSSSSSTTQPPDSVSEPSSGGSTQSSFSPSYTNNSSSTSTSSSGKNPTSPATEKNVTNMSIKDLESELVTAKSATSEAEKAYMAEIEKADSELAEKVDAVDKNIETTQTNLDAANTQLTDEKSALENDKSSLAAATSSIGNIESNISSLSSKLNQNPPLSDEQKTSIKSQISALQDEKKTLEDSIPALEKSIKDREEAIRVLEQESIPKLNEDLKKYEEELAQYALKLNELTSSNPTLQASLTAFNDAVAYESSVEEMLANRRAAQIREGESVKLDKGDAPKDYSGLSSFCYDNLPMRYMLGDEEYYCVGFEGYDLDGDGTTDFKPNSWEEVQRYFKNGGVRNLGQFGNMQCHNYSEMLGQFVLGQANQEFVQALYDETNKDGYGDKDQAGKMGTDSKWNPRRFAKCAAKDRDEERAIIENELQNGRPTVIRVDGYSHYVLAVGISKDGDILIWDSYEGAMEKLARSSNDDNNDSGRKLVKTDGVNVFCDGYSYQYSTAKAIDYWTYVGGTQEYVLQNGYL